MENWVERKPPAGYIPWQESWSTYTHHDGRVYLRRVTAPHRFASDWRQAANIEAEVRGIHLEELISGWLSPWRAAKRARERRIARRSGRRRARYMAVCQVAALVIGSAYLSAVLWPYSGLLTGAAAAWGAFLVYWVWPGR